MKLVIYIPDWVIDEKRALHIMAGIERVTFKRPWEDHWHVKKSRCSSCGECCKDLGCDELAKDNSCKKEIERPFFCCTTEPKSIESCTSRYN